MELIRSLLIFLIKYLRPLLGPSGCCIYPVSCTTFAIEQLNTQPPFVAIWQIIKRVVSCNPFAKYCAIKKNQSTTPCTSSARRSSVRSEDGRIEK